MNEMRQNDPIVVLMVEDDPGDVELTREGLKDSKVDVSLYVVEDGERAMRFLRGEAGYAGSPRPDIILLDLNMPRKNGIETLHEIKADPDLKAIPVVILTSSEAEADINRSYIEGANSYLVKPIGFESFTRLVREIEQFWFTIVKLPKKDKGI